MLYMKRLSEILMNVDVQEVMGLTDIDINIVCFDSRNVEKGSLFIAIKGTNTDGHQYISQAIKIGAKAIVYEDSPQSTVHSPQENTTYIKVKDSSKALGIISSNFYDNPSDKLNLVGITGTNGKTTIATLLYNLFRNAGYKAGLISTVIYKINDEEVKATHTTPDSIQLNFLLKRMVEAGCTHCFMEVSSHSVVQNRIAGLDFAGGVFTNITHDHLDYHKTFEEYLKAKKRFFDNLKKEAFALSNSDDRNGGVILQNTNALKKTYSLHKMSDFRAKVIQNEFSGLQLHIDGKDVWFKLIGSFNASNLLAIYSTAVLLGEDKDKTLSLMSNLDPVVGRFEVIRVQSSEFGVQSSKLKTKNAEQITAIVDYAHTPDALSNVINTINEIKAKAKEKGSSKLITVIGCGGDRDRTKRPIMAKIASENSDRVILTSDNPRSEEPEQIIIEMESGIEAKAKAKVLAIVNRKEAIKTASALAMPGDIILVAGKGHETYQEIKGVKYPFDDREILKEIMNYKL
jgi:UDP-N-acetylmuramoyl-L-alanyl-D-glutamate--2,6-diaminopimelate ligase